MLPRCTAIYTYDLPLSEINGLILGEIFGLSAGLTSVELTLFLFFGFRPAFDSILFVPPIKAGLVGDATALSMGLVFPDNAAPADGVLNGPSLGVLRADIRGVAPSSLSKEVSMWDRGGLSREASGSVRSSSIGISPAIWMKLGDCCRCIKEAGVAGQPAWLKGCPLWAKTAGECVTEPGLGGGPISLRFSGETESNSELSLLRGTSNPLVEGRADVDLCASSTRPLTSFGGINAAAVVFRRFGFTMGDCRTRAEGLAGRGAFLLVLRSRLACSGCADVGPRPTPPISMSRGDAAVELAAVALGPGCPCIWWWFCAFSAGDVSGLK